jgi:hypothetical protein
MTIMDGGRRRRETIALPSGGACAQSQTGVLTARKTLYNEETSHGRSRTGVMSIRWTPSSTVVVGLPMVGRRDRETDARLPNVDDGIISEGRCLHVKLLVYAS